MGKKKWRKISAEGAERSLETRRLREKACELDASSALFELDSKGASDDSHLSRAARRLLRSRVISGEEVGTSSSKAPLLQVASASHKRQLLKVLKAKAQREAEERRTRTKRGEVLEDLWGDSVFFQPPRSEGKVAQEKIRSEGAVFGADALKKAVPAVVPPGSGESYKPSEVQRRRQLLSAAADAVAESRVGRASHVALPSPEEEEQLLIAHSNPKNKTLHSHPVDAALREALGEERVASLSEEEKHAALMRLVLRLPETTHADKTEAQAANTTDDELTPSQQALRSPRKSSQAWIMQKEKKLHCQAEDEFAALLRGVADPKKKTRADRNRQLRHLGQLRSAAAKRERATLRKDLARLPELLGELGEEAKALEQRGEKKREGLKKKLEAARRGRVAFKLGRKRFVEPPVAVLLDGEGASSLRATKVWGSADVARERLLSVQRRGLTELPSKMTAAHAARVRRLYSRQKLSRKIVKKKQRGESTMQS